VYALNVYGDSVAQLNESEVSVGQHVLAKSNCGEWRNAVVMSMDPR